MDTEDSLLITALVLERCIALVNFVAFFSFLIQMKGLIMSNGILPIKQTLKVWRTKLSRRYLPNSWQFYLRSIYYYPTLFWICSSDEFLWLVMHFGLLSCLLAFLGCFPPLFIFFSTVCYLSFHTVSQPWLGLQMHVTILETNFAYLITSAFRTTQPFLMILVMRFLVWRIMLGCGACKYAGGDPRWRDLTAMNYHYFTQPLPNPVSWYVQQFPTWIHKYSVICTHLIEGPLTFLVFGNRLSRMISFLCFVGLNLFINITGNYGFLGLLTCVQCIALLDDKILQWVVPHYIWLHLRTDFFLSSSLQNSIILSLYPIIVLYLMVSLVPLLRTFHGKIPWVHEITFFITLQLRMNRMIANVVKVSIRSSIAPNHSTLLILSSIFKPFRLCLQYIMHSWWYIACSFWEWLSYVYYWQYPFHLINHYAKFGTITTRRFEIIVEGSLDGIQWKEYVFRYKPGPVDRAPPILPFHLPGLDWQLWFLPLNLLQNFDERKTYWFWCFIENLLKGKKEVLDLLAENPFPNKPPLIIQVKIYQYFFNYDTNDGGKKWWRRNLISILGRFDCDSLKQYMKH